MIIDIQHLDMPKTSLEAIVKYSGHVKVRTRSIVVSAPYPYQLETSKNEYHRDMSDPKFRASRRRVFACLSYLIERKIKVKFIHQKESNKLISEIDFKLYSEYLLLLTGS